MQADKFAVEAGTFLLSTGTRVRVDGSAGEPGTEFEAEETLGYDENTRFRVDAAWRISPRHAVTALWFDNTGRSSRVIDTTINVGDVTYPVNAEIESHLSTRIIDLSYEYIFMQRSDFELAGSFGLHKISFGLQLTAQGDGSSEELLSNKLSTGAPLPLFGVRGSWQLTPELRVDAHAQYFTISIDDYDGNVVDLRADATWMFSRHFGVGAGYNHFRFKFDLDRPNFNGSLRWKYGGPLLFLRGAW